VGANTRKAKPEANQSSLFVLPPPRPVFKAKRVSPPDPLYGLAARDLRLIGEALSGAKIGDDTDSIYVMALKAVRQLNKLRQELMTARLEVVKLKRQLKECQEKTEGAGSGQENDRV